MPLRAYPTAVKPIHIGRRLLAAIDESARAGDGRAASNYTVTMHPKDLVAWKDVTAEVERELCEAGNLHAEREGIGLSAPIRVVVRSDEHLRRGRFDVTAATVGADLGRPTIADRQSSMPDGATDTDEHERVVVANPAPSLTTSSIGVMCALVLPDGTRHVLENERVTIGRQSTCSIVIKDSNVSREHVQFRRGHDGWTVRDLGSTNGTKINGVRVEGEQLLANGDVVLVGSIPVRFEIA